MKDRIEKIMQAEQMTASKFADAIGVQRSNISHILSGRNNPSLELINKILDRFENINADWLLLGKGNMSGATTDSPENNGYSFIKGTPNTTSKDVSQPVPVRIVVFYSDHSFEEYRPKV